MEFVNAMRLVMHQNAFFCYKINTGSLELFKGFLGFCHLLDPYLPDTFVPGLPYHSCGLVLSCHYYKSADVVRKAFDVAINL